MVKKTLPDAATIRKLLDYDPDAGTLIWRERPLSSFKNKGASLMWNKRFAGKTAGWLNTIGYIMIDVGKVKKLGAHRVIFVWMTGRPPPQHIDHINGNPSDNRWVNLRAATASQNQHNRKLQKNNKSGFKGVYREANGNRWVATIALRTRIRRLGTFDTAEEAFSAYCKAAKELFGEFANYGHQ